MILNRLLSQQVGGGIAEPLELMGLRGAIPPSPDFGTNRSKIFSLKRPWNITRKVNIF